MHSAPIKTIEPALLKAVAEVRESAGSTSLSITQLIDESRFGFVQALTFLLCALCAALDGFDTQCIGIAAHSIAVQFDLGKAQIGPVFGLSLVGGMLGCMVFGPLSDRYGRKAMLLVTTLTFAAFTAATAFVWSYPSLLAVRFLAGIGLGGAAPCFVTLASEYAPARMRGMVVNLLYAAFPLGGMAGGFFSGYILQHADWRMIFYIGGILPAGLLVFLVVLLPESLCFLVDRQAPRARIWAVAKRLKPNLDAATTIRNIRRPLAEISAKHLFIRGRAFHNLLLWAPFFLGFGTVIFIPLWAPLLLNKAAGVSAGSLVAINNLGGVLGVATAGLLLRRFGLFRVTALAFGVGGTMTIAMGFVATNATLLPIVAFVSGAFLAAAAISMLAIAATLYPTAIRATAIGWAMAAGKLGQISIPWAGGAVYAKDWDTTTIFLSLGALPLAGCLIVLLIRHWPISAFVPE